MEPSFQAWLVCCLRGGPGPGSGKDEGSWADEKSPCDARPHSSWCSLSCLSWLQPRPSTLSSVALGLKFYKLYFFLVHWLHFSFCQFTPGRGKELEKEMATHSSILAWRIPWTEEPGGLQSSGYLYLHCQVFLGLLLCLKLLYQI